MPAHRVGSWPAKSESSFRAVRNCTARVSTLDMIAKACVKCRAIHAPARQDFVKWDLGATLATDQDYLIARSGLGMVGEINAQVLQVYRIEQWRPATSNEGTRPRRQRPRQPISPSDRQDSYAHARVTANGGGWPPVSAGPSDLRIMSRVLSDRKAGLSLAPRPTRHRLSRRTADDQDRRRTGPFRDSRELQSCSRP